MMHSSFGCYRSPVYSYGQCFGPARVGGFIKLLRLPWSCSGRRQLRSTMEPQVRHPSFELLWSSRIVIDLEGQSFS
jgi:hypothetical protein